jgi:hypothetical protein
MLSVFLSRPSSSKYVVTERPGASWVASGGTGSVNTDVVMCRSELPSKKPEYATTPSTRNVSRGLVIVDITGRLKPSKVVPCCMPWGSVVLTTFRVRGSRVREICTVGTPVASVLTSSGTSLNGSYSTVAVRLTSSRDVVIV